MTWTDRSIDRSSILGATRHPSIHPSGFKSRWGHDGRAATTAKAGPARPGAPRSCISCCFPFCRIPCRLERASGGGSGKKKTHRERDFTCLDGGRNTRHRHASAQRDVWNSTATFRAISHRVACDCVALYVWEMYVPCERVATFPVQRCCRFHPSIHPLLLPPAGRSPSLDSNVDPRSRIAP